MSALVANYHVVPEPYSLPKHEMSGVLRPQHVMVATTSSGTIQSCVTVRFRA